MAWSEYRNTPQLQHGGGKRTTFKKWATLEPGTIIEGVWHQPRPVKGKEGTGDYSIGEIEHADGKLTVFTIPNSLKRLTDQLRVGDKVQIIFNGSAPAVVGMQYQFRVLVDDGT